LLESLRNEETIDRGFPIVDFDVFYIAIVSRLAEVILAIKAWKDLMKSYRSPHSVPRRLDQVSTVRQGLYVFPRPRRTIATTTAPVVGF